MADYCILVWIPDEQTAGEYICVGHYTHLEEDMIRQFNRLKEIHGPKSVRMYIDLNSARKKEILDDTRDRIKRMTEEILAQRRAKRDK